MKTIKELVAKKHWSSPVHKLTHKMLNSIRLIWVTMVAYIIYVEFYKDLITIL